jgi:hypothetical protein
MTILLITLLQLSHQTPNAIIQGPITFSAPSMGQIELTYSPIISFVPNVQIGSSGRKPMSLVKNCVTPSTMRNVPPTTQTQRTQQL